MAHTEEMLIHGVMRPVSVFDSSAQEIDDAAPGDDAVIPGSGGGGGHGGGGGGAGGKAVNGISSRNVTHGSPGAGGAGGAGGNGAPGLVLIYY